MGSQVSQTNLSPGLHPRKSEDIRYSTWVETGLVDAVWVDHRVERAGMEVIALLFFLLLCCVVCGEWSLRTDWRFRISDGHGDGFVSFMCLEVSLAL